MKAVLRIASDDRQEQRSAAYRDVELGAAGTDGIAGVVTNISRSGFRIVVEKPLTANSVVWLKIGDVGPLMARVVWFDGDAAGCEFAGRLHPDMVAELTRG